MKKQILIFLIIILTNKILSQTALAEKAFENCEGLEFDKLYHTNINRKKIRKDLNNPFSSKYQEIIDYYKNDDTGKLFSSFTGFAILFIALMICVIISTIFYICFACGKYKKPESEVKKNCYMVLSIVLIILFLAFFIALVVLLQRADSNFSKAKCGFHLLPMAVIEGLLTEDDRFIGLVGIGRVYQNLENEISQLILGAPLFEMIFRKEIANNANSAYHSTNFFKNKYILDKTPNMEGTDKVPISVFTLEPGLNAELEAKFGTLAQTAEKANLAAFYGRNVKKEMKDQVIAYKNNLDRINQKLATIGEKFGKYADKALGHGKNGYISVIFFGGLLFIGSIVLVIIIYCMKRSKECFYCKKCSKIILIFFGIILFGYFIAIFFLMIGSSSVSSFCNVMGKLNSGDVSGLLEFNQNNLDPEVSLVISTCFNSNFNSNLFPIISQGTEYPESDYKKINSIINGVSYYYLYQENKKNDTSTLDLTSLESDLDKIKKGTLEDHIGIKKSLKELNDLIDCSSEFFEFDKLNCESTNCRSIIETTDFNAPACSSEPQKVNKIFQNLKLYIEKEDILIDKMKEDLKQTGDSPYIRYEEGKRVLNSVNDEFTKVSGLMMNTLKQFAKYNLTYDKITECKNLKKKAIEWEYHLCFKYSRYLYLVFVMAIFLGIFMIFIGWFICCALRGDRDTIKNEDENEDNEMQGNNNTIQGNNSGEEIDYDDFEDNEKAPVF